MSLPMDARAVVTGAGSGLGRAFCVELANRGSSLVVSDINVEAAEETAEQLRRRGATAVVVPCDVADPEQVDQLAKKAYAELGNVDVLINNAGVAVGGRIDEVALEDLRWVFDINLWGVIYGCRAFLPRMRREKNGYILNVASAAGLLSPPELGPYNITKAGVVALSETLFAELRGSGVSVTVLCPTFFKTNIAKSSRGPGPAEQREMIHRMMERSKVQAPEVARVALDALGRGELYAVPMLDGRVFWRLKRALPTRFYELLAVSQKFIQPKP